MYSPLCISYLGWQTQLKNRSCYFFLSVLLSNPKHQTLKKRLTQWPIFTCSCFEVHEGNRAFVCRRGKTCIAQNSKCKIKLIVIWYFSGLYESPYTTKNFVVVAKFLDTFWKNIESRWLQDANKLSLHSWKQFWYKNFLTGLPIETSQRHGTVQNNSFDSVVFEKKKVVNLLFI